MQQEDAVALLLAAVSDGATKERLAQLRDAQEAHDQALAAAQQQAAENQRTLRAAGEQLRIARETQDANEQRAHQLEQWEATLREVNDSLNREKAAFEDVRHRVEVDQAARENALRLREAAMAEREARMADREIEVQRREEELIAAEAAHARRADALKAALAVQ